MRGLSAVVQGTSLLYFAIYLVRISVRVSTVPKERNARRERERGRAREREGMQEAKNETHGDRN
jgi:hypothetical protein